MDNTIALEQKKSRKAQDQLVAVKRKCQEVEESQFTIKHEHPRVELCTSPPSAVGHTIPCECKSTST